jgi:hypothetical protein
MSEGPPFTDNKDIKNGSEGGKPVKTYAGKKLTPRQKQRLRVGIHQQELNKLNEADGTMEGIKKDEDQQTTAEYSVLESADTQTLPEVATETVKESAPDPTPYLVEYAHDYDERDSNSIPKTPFQPGPSFSEISDTEVRGTESHYNITKEPAQSIRITGSEEVLQTSHSEGSVARATFPNGEVSNQTVETKADTAPEVVQKGSVSAVESEEVAPPKATPESSEPERTESSPSALSEVADPEMEKAIQEFTELERELATRGVTADNEPSIRKGRKVLEMRAKDTETDPVVVGWHKEQYMRYLQQHISEMKKMVGESTPSARVEEDVDVASEKVEATAPETNVSPEKTPTEASPKPASPAEKEVDTTPKVVKTAIPEKNASDEIELELVPKDAENVPEELTLVPKEDESADREEKRPDLSLEQVPDEHGGAEEKAPLESGETRKIAPEAETFTTDALASLDENDLRKLVEHLNTARQTHSERDVYYGVINGLDSAPAFLPHVPELKELFDNAPHDLVDHLARTAEQALGEKERNKAAGRYAEVIDYLDNARSMQTEQDVYSDVMGTWQKTTDSPLGIFRGRPDIKERFAVGRGKPYTSTRAAAHDLIEYLAEEAQRGMGQKSATERPAEKTAEEVIAEDPQSSAETANTAEYEMADPDDESTLKAVPMDATLKERPVYEEGDPDDPSTWQVVPIDAKLKKLKVHQEGDPEDPSTWEAVPTDAKLVPRESKKTSESIAEAKQESEVAPKSETEPQQEPVTEEEATPTPDAPAESAEQVEPADPEALARFHEARNAFKANADAIDAAKAALEEAVGALQAEKSQNGFVGLVTGTRQAAKENIKQCEENYINLVRKVPSLRNERIEAFRALRLKNAERQLGEAGEGMTAGERMHAKYASWYEAALDHRAENYKELMKQMKQSADPETRQSRIMGFLSSKARAWSKLPLHKKVLWGTTLSVPVAAVAALSGAGLATAAGVGGAVAARRAVGTAVGATLGVAMGSAAYEKLTDRDERLTREAVEASREKVRQTYGTEAEVDPAEVLRTRKKIDEQSTTRKKVASGARFGVAAGTGFIAGAGTASAMGALENLASNVPDIPETPPAGNGMVFDSGSPSPEAYTGALPVPPEVVPGADIPGVPPETTSGGNGNVFESGPIDLDAVRDPEPTMTPEVPTDLPSAEYAPNLPPAETAPDIVPEVVPDTAPEVVPDIAPEVAPDITPEVVPDIAPEVITPSSIEVNIEPGGNLWDSVADKLESSKLIASKADIAELRTSGGDWEEALAHRNHLIDELKDHFADMSQQELKDIGFTPNRFGEYNINDVFPGNKIDLTSVLGDSDKFSDAVTNADKVSLRPAATSGIELGGGPATPSPAEVIPTGSETPAPAEWSTQSDELSHLFDQYLNQSPDTGGAEDAAVSAVPEVPVATENPLVDPEVLPDADATVTGEHPDMHPGAEPTPTLEDIMGGNRPETDTSTSIRNATDVTPVEPTVTEALRSEVLQAEQAPTAEGAPAPETATNEEGVSTSEGAEESAVAAQEGAGAEEEAAELTNLPPEQSVSENLEQLAEIDYHGVNTLNDFRSIWGELREGINGSPLLSTPVLGRYVQLQSSWGPMSHVRLGDIYDSVDGATFTIDGATHTLVPETEMMLRSIIDATRELPGAEATYELAEREGYSVGDYIKKLHEVRLAQENVSSLNRA